MPRPRGRTPSERRWAMDGPSARAVGQTGEPREPDAGGRTSGGGLSFGDFSLATQRKVTRQAAQRRRNPVEDGVLVSCMAKPCQRGWRPLTLTLSRKGRGNGYHGAMRFAPLIAPYVLPARGGGTVTADDYASLIDPTGEAMPIPCCVGQRRYPTPHPSPLPPGERGWSSGADGHLRRG